MGGAEYMPKCQIPNPKLEEQANTAVCKAEVNAGCELVRPTSWHYHLDVIWVFAESSLVFIARCMRVLILGCGYVGLPLGVELVRRGHETYGVCRTSERAREIYRAGVNAIVTDLTKPTALEAVEPAFDWIVNTLSSSK